MTLEERVAKLEMIIEAKDAEIDRLRQRVADLERRLGEPAPPAPPEGGAGADKSARSEPSGRKAGGQPGHKGHKRVMVPLAKVTRRVDCFPKDCRRCGKSLPRTPDKNPLLHQVVEIPDIVPDVTQFDQHRVVCACGETTCGQLPAGVPAGMLGPRLLSFASMLTGELNLSRRKAQTLLSDMLGIKVSLGTVSESEQVVSEAIAGPVEQARLHALAAKVKHADGTTWYRNGLFRALWVLATHSVTVFTIVDSATKQAMRDWLGRTGVLVSDRGTQLSFWAMHRRQICWAHLIRKFAEYAGHRGQAGDIGTTLLMATRTLFDEWHRVRDGTVTRRTFERRTRVHRAMIELLLERGRSLPLPIAGSCNDVLEHRAALWTFVYREGVEPTNNHAERELRDFVLWRKISLGSQSERGDLFAARIKSVVCTCRKQGRHVWHYLTQATQASLHGRSAPSLLPTSP